MGKREVAIYTCDGCKRSSTLGLTDTPRGYTRVVLAFGEVWLCTVCYGAVEWVARFQGLTIPPTIYGTGVSASLREPTDSSPDRRWPGEYGSDGRVMEAERALRDGPATEPMDGESNG